MLCVTSFGNDSGIFLVWAALVSSWLAFLCLAGAVGVILVFVFVLSTHSQPMLQ